MQHMALPDGLRDTYRAQFPEHSEDTDAAVDAVLELARHFHTYSSMATVYAAAHLRTLRAAEQPDGAAGKVDGGSGAKLSETLGAHSITYARLPTSDDDRSAFFARTPYGRMFLQLERRATAASIRIV